MAKVYSWAISEKPRTYAYIIHPHDTTKEENPETGEPRAFVGSELDGENLENVKNWTINCTDEEYEVQFKKMVQLCKDMYYTVEFESAGTYLDVEESCDNLRGPEGRGIRDIRIVYEDLTKTVHRITYTDGETYTFTVYNGTNGTNGEKGDTGISSVQVTIYKSSEKQPDTPEGGEYDFTNYKLTPPDGWETNCDELEAPIWMSSRLFTNPEPDTDSKWTTPVKITGDNGIPGADGITTEFIYFLGEIPNDPNLSTDYDVNGKLPNQAGYVPTNGWTGSPTGIDEDNKIEWCSTRNKTVDDNGTPKWSEWSKAFKWSIWGTNGINGDGVQYIYLLAEEKYTPEEIVLPNDWNEEDSEYQKPNKEWIPTVIEENGKPILVITYEDGVEKEEEKYTNNWYDSPLTVTKNYPHLWVSVRKYTYDSTEEKKMWGKYSTPSLFAKFGQDGKSATYIRKIYITTERTDIVPPVPQGSNSALDIDVWSLTFPSNYENGENVVWATEAEASSVDNTFVYYYKRISITLENGEEKLPEGYGYTSDNFIEYIGDSVPDEKVHQDYNGEGIKYEGIYFDGKYYVWSGGWCTPYLVTGVKGDKADPINYTTYVFAYGYDGSTPGVPTGTSIKEPGVSVDGLDRPIQWEDAPIVKKTNENTERIEGAKEKYTYADGTEEWVIRRWYQCVGYVNGNDNSIINWGAVLPLYAKDGEAGKDGSYTEYRFYVTKDQDTPEVVTVEDGQVIRVPYTPVGNKKDWWLTIKDEGFNSKIPSGGAMWQMWAYITKEKTTDEQEEQTTVPQSKTNAMIDGVKPGINYDEIGNDELTQDSDNKDNNDTPSVNENDKIVSEWYGPIRISGEKGETGERGPAGLRGVTGVPGANYIQMYCLGTPSKEVKRYDFDSINGENKFSDGYFGGIYKGVDESAIPPERLEDWYKPKDMPSSTVLRCTNDDEEAKILEEPKNLGRVFVRIDNEGKTGESHTFFLVSMDYEKKHEEIREAIEAKPLTEPLSKEEAENFNIYTWCLQGIETWTEGEHEGYVELKQLPEGVDEDDVPEETTIPKDKDNFSKYIKIQQYDKEGNPLDYKYYEWQVFDGDKVQHKKSIIWNPPFKLQGADGLKGKDGTRGQMIYPMGVYSQNEVYITTTEKAPYVYDPSDGMFYVYNVVGEDKAWVGTLPTTNNDPEYYKKFMVHPQDANKDNTEVVVKFDDVQGGKKYIKLSTDGNYYVRDGEEYKMVSKYKYSIGGSGKPNTWYIDQGGATPSSNYNKFTEANQAPAWVRFESFQAFYTSLGVIENGLIGSAVYNNEFMYSQYGVAKDGRKVSFAEVALQGTTSGFLSGYEYNKDGETDNNGNKTGKYWKYRGTKNYIDNYDVNPYEKTTVTNEKGEEVETYLHEFMPNVCINFLTGQMWLSTGKVKFSKDEIKLLTGKGDNISGFVTENNFAEIFSNSEVKITGDRVTIAGDLTVNNVITVNEENVTIKDVIIEGSSRSPFVLDYDDGKIENYHDNFAINRAVTHSQETTETNVMYTNNLKWTPDQSGREINIVNYKWKSSLGSPLEDTGGLDGITIQSPSYFDIITNKNWTRESLITKQRLKDTGLTDIDKINYYECYRFKRSGGSRGTGDVALYSEFKFAIPQGTETYDLYIKSAYTNSNSSKANLYVIVSNPNKTLSISQDDDNTDVPTKTDEVKTVITWNTNINDRFQKISFSSSDGFDKNNDNIVTILIKEIKPASVQSSTNVLSVLPKPKENSSYFFEYGLKLESLNIKGEIINLIGYGDGDNFYGWIVKNRNNINNELFNIGKPLNYVAQGKLFFEVDNEKSTAEGKLVYKRSDNDSYIETYDGTIINVTCEFSSRLDSGFSQLILTLSSSNWGKFGDYVIFITPDSCTYVRNSNTLNTNFPNESYIMIYMRDFAQNPKFGISFIIARPNMFADNLFIV